MLGGVRLSRATRPTGGPEALDRDRYKWVALSNTTLATLIATIDLSVVLIALPDIFRGITSTRSCRGTRPTCCGC